jgi:nucleotide-binding universal stress UspA family protein
VHVDLQDGLGHPQQRLDGYREMAENVGARYREVRGTNPADTLGDIALRESANRVVVGTRRSRLGKLVRGSVASRIRRRVPDLQVDEVSV